MSARDRKERGCRVASPVSSLSATAFATQKEEEGGGDFAQEAAHHPQVFGSSPSAQHTAGAMAPGSV